MILAALSLALAFIGVVGQSAVPTSKPDGCSSTAACTGTLRGTVSLADGGVPVGAYLFLQPVIEPRPTPVGEYVLRDDDGAAMSRGQFHGIVDATGKVEINDVRPGLYIPVVQVPGYISPESLPSTPQPGVTNPAALAGTENMVRVRAGDAATFHLRLQHGGTIAGVARSADGTLAHRESPILQQVALSLLTRQADGSFAHTAGIGAAHTDAAGRFTFADLPPGDYVIMTALPAPMVKTASGQQGANGGLVFSGGTSRLGKATVTHVVGTEKENAEILLPTTGLSDLTGRVLAPDGSPLTRGLVRIQPVHDSPSAWMVPISSIATPIASDGTFQFHSLLPDQYEVWLQTEPEVTFMGVTEDHHGVRMRATPPPYTSPRQPVDVSGAATASVVLQLRSADDHPPVTTR